jgi:hypothetical protein
MLALLLIVVLGVCMDPEEGRRRGRGREGVHDVLQWRVRLEAQLTCCRRQGWTVFLLLMWVTLVLQVASSFLDR